MDIIEEIHTWIQEKRLLNRVSYKVMGKTIGYTDTGFKKALVNNNLSPTHLQTIINEFNFIKDFTEKFGLVSFINNDGPDINKKNTNEKDGSDSELLKSIIYVIENKDEALKVNMYKSEIKLQDKNIIKKPFYFNPFDDAKLI